LNSNQIKNVFNGIYVGGDQVGTDGQNYMVADNTIDHFAGDGIDHSATNIIIQGNHITNGLDICASKCIHNDGIQGWNWEDKSGITNKNVVIDSNYIESQTVTNLPLATSALRASRSLMPFGRTFPLQTTLFLRAVLLESAWLESTGSKSSTIQ
jgi:hypothetical protein